MERSLRKLREIVADLRTLLTTVMVVEDYVKESRFDCV